MIRYFVTIDEHGKPLNGSTLDESQGQILNTIYTHEVTKEIWDNTDKYRFVDGKWEEIINETASGE